MLTAVAAHGRSEARSTAENPMPAVQRSQLSFWATALRNYRPHGKGAYIGTRPGKASGAYAAISEMTAPHGVDGGNGGRPVAP